MAKAKDTPIISKGAAKVFMNLMASRVNNTSALLRRNVIQRFLNPAKDINGECGYPDSITTNDYRQMYNRESVGYRIVTIEPEECWTNTPSIEENDDPTKTPWEEEFDDLNEKKHLFYYMEKADVLSGIGQYGIVLFGLSDGKELHEPFDGINEVTGEGVGNSEHELLYIKVFSQDTIDIYEKEKDTSSPRYGMPIVYNVIFDEDSAGQKSTRTVKVHWTRVLHVADNREGSEVYGVPRMQSVYNRLLDIRKILAGSAEMFWKGGFPGFAFEVNPEMNDVSIDQDTLQEQMEDYSAGLQRYLAIEGMTVKSMDPQVADPMSHTETQLKAIAMAKGIPYRLLIGSEKAQLASTQDTKVWNQRIARRQERYVTPMIIRPFIERLMLYGVLPLIDNFNVVWPDRDEPNEKDIAEVARIRTEALAKYVGGDVRSVIPPSEFLDVILGLDADTISMIEDAVLEDQAELAEEQAEQAEEEQARLDAEAKRAAQVAGVNPGKPGNVGGKAPVQPDNRV